jgi:hypothetical protein
MTGELPGFFQGTEMPTAGWWEALWPDPAGVLAAVGLKPGMAMKLAALVEIPPYHYGAVFEKATA